MAKLIADGLRKIERRILKVAFVGLDRDGRKLMKKTLQKDKEDKFVHHFFDDYEKAKEWLIQER